MANFCREVISVPLNSGFPGAYSDTVGSVSSEVVKFEFALAQKPANVGTTVFKHWWMPINSIYGQRNQTGKNREALADLFWASSLADDGFGATSTDVKEIYLLTKLLPIVRSTGGRRIFDDGRLVRSKAADVNQLNRMIQSESQGSVDSAEFQTQVAAILGPPKFSQAAKDLYCEVANEIFPEASEMLVESPQKAFANVVGKWDSWNRRIGRRSGQIEQKEILNVLSYEARAAIHRCYSHAWLQLLKKWYHLEAICQESLSFHRLWHFELLDYSDGDVANRHLFQGHIFGLHPAGSNLIATAAGRALISDLIKQSPGSEEFDVAFNRLLNGLLIAVYDFARQRSESPVVRKQPKAVQVKNSDTANGSHFRSGRRVHRVRESDD